MSEKFVLDIIRGKYKCMQWEIHLVYQTRHLAIYIDIRKKVLKMISKLNSNRQKSCST